MPDAFVLPPDLQALVDDAIASGDYSDPEAVLRDAFGLWQDQRALLRLSPNALPAAAEAAIGRLWDEGMTSGQSLEGEAVLLELRERFGSKAN
ncbi:MAG: hypothetical protein KDC18_03600 [Alphaproteobacteria bacterium]|nr:hypothetical protein [Alphaproteobacteria bacterium]MCB9928404.1 hypothetical protein [Alphaproteobacteria bacterium]